MWEQGHRDSGLMHGSEVTVGKGWREEGRTGRTGGGGRGHCELAGARALISGDSVESAQKSDKRRSGGAVRMATEKKQERRAEKKKEERWRQEQRK